VQGDGAVPEVVVVEAAAAVEFDQVGGAYAEVVGPAGEPELFGKLVQGFAAGMGRHLCRCSTNPGLRLIGQDERKSIDWRGAGRRANHDRG